MQCTIATSVRLLLILTADRGRQKWRDRKCLNCQIAKMFLLSSCKTNMTNDKITTHIMTCNTIIVVMPRCIKTLRLLTDTCRNHMVSSWSLLFVLVVYNRYDVPEGARFETIWGRWLKLWANAQMIIRCVYPVFREMNGIHNHDSRL